MKDGVWNGKKRITLILIIIILLASVTTASANDGVLGVTPDGVYPITQSDIMMAAEEITIKVRGAAAIVTCRFDFKNLGDVQTVLMGFPAKLDEEVSDGLTTEEDISVRNFTARDEHGEIPVTLSDTIPNPPLKEMNGMEEYSKWYNFSVHFDKNEEKTLHHTYEVNFSNFSDGNVELGYVIETGSLWKGPIGHSKVVFDFGDIPMYSITNVYPNNYYRMEENKLIFERTDFKPDYNLWVSMNQYMYTNDEWFDMHYSENGKEDAEKKIELFKISSEAIRNNTEKYYELYKSLIHDDPVSALYIKSALGLPDGNEKPKITECRIIEHSGNTWKFEIYGTDPDGDLADCRAEVTGIQNFQYFNDIPWRGRLYFNPDEKKFYTRGELEVQEENRPFSITFMMTDAAGNSDTESLLLQADDPGSTPVSEDSSVISEDNVPAYGIKEKNGARIFPVEEDTLPMLIAGVTAVLMFCLAVEIILFVKKKNRGYLLFISQLIFIVLSFYQIAGILIMRDVTDGAMLSENISLKIGISAVFWAISMLCMAAGIVMTARKEEP